MRNNGVNLLTADIVGNFPIYMQLRKNIKDFIHEIMLKGLQELKERQVRENLKLSIQESKEGKVKSRGSFANKSLFLN